MLNYRYCHIDNKAITQEVRENVIVANTYNPPSRRGRLRQCTIFSYLKVKIVRFISKKILQFKQSMFVFFFFERMSLTE